MDEPQNTRIVIFEDHEEITAFERTISLAKRRGFSDLASFLAEVLKNSLKRLEQQTPKTSIKYHLGESDVYASTGSWMNGQGEE
jgi:hypothetical protein